MIREIVINDENSKIHVSIVRSERKTVGLEVCYGGDVLVRAPNRLSDVKIEKFINEHLKCFFEKYYFQKQP